MTRRRLIWAIAAFVVAFTVFFFLSGEARAEVALGVGEVETPAATGLRTTEGFVSPEVSESPSPASLTHDATMTLGAALLLVVGMAVFALLCVGVLALIDMLRERWRRVEADMDALIDATHECPPNGPCAWCASKRNGPPKRAVEPAVQPPAGMSPWYDTMPPLTPEGRAALNANKQRSIARDQRYPLAVLVAAAEATALTDKALAERIEQWSKGAW